MELELLDLENEYMDIEAHGFVHSCYNVLRAGFKGVNGTVCIIEEVANIMLSCTGYASDLTKCTTAVPSDMKAIIKTAAQMVTIGDNIMHLNTQLCVPDEDSSSSWLKNGLHCTKEVLLATMSLVRRMNIIIKLSAKLPTDTASCYLDATHKVVNACNAFVPNINSCIAHMTS
ncbi:hypothetical protein KR009_006863 [Drosophila setifemur]|nr:hypothetical protein KR009_006863 [Drosophila setifemur]